MSALKATDAPQQVIANALTNHRKLTGVRASAKLSQEEIAALGAEGKEVKQISAAQQSFDSMLDTFDKQIKLLATIPQYAPNETELKTATLQALFTKLQSYNIAVLNAKQVLDAARIARNKEVYDEEVGIKAIAIDVKNYVKSLFGLGSPQFKQIASLGFSKLS